MENGAAEREADHKGDPTPSTTRRQSSIRVALHTSWACAVPAASVLSAPTSHKPLLLQVVREDTGKFISQREKGLLALVSAIVVGHRSHYVCLGLRHHTRSAPVTLPLPQSQHRRFLFNLQTHPTSSPLGPMR